jgi:hypothetical protein
MPLLSLNGLHQADKASKEPFLPDIFCDTGNDLYQTIFYAKMAKKSRLKRSLAHTPPMRSEKKSLD